ncbi:response regulator receiver and ANTAR domain protein [Ruminococcaceae bacterium YRB3002]|nr:response regulator receiver and ANTAR domain protein [Ruminococcaceae bacterium YRB3002]
MHDRAKYSVLIASSNKKFDEILTSLLPADEYGPVDTVDNAGLARRKLTDKSYDILIVNSPLRDENGIDLTIDIADETNISIMLLVDAAHLDEVNAVVGQYGILTLSKPTNRAAVTQSLKLMCATRNRLKRMEKKTASFEEKINEIKLVNRAKLLLMEKEGLSEDTAHKFIEKLAMDSRSPRVRVAEEIIARYSHKA